ncbi:MAG: hypothetical protein KDI64_02450, partial [Candidatus Accumulibacter sp.]|nr:hypothetical protein [Accumulibacter sp.]
MLMATDRSGQRFLVIVSRPKFAKAGAIAGRPRVSGHFTDCRCSQLRLTTRAADWCALAIVP